MGIDDALVQDGHLASGIVHGVIRAFRQFHTTSHHLHGAVRHIISTQGDDIGRVALIHTRHDELVLLGVLLGHGLRRVVELAEHILLGLLWGETSLDQLLSQIVAEGLCRGKEYTPVADGIALNEVVVAVGVGLVVIVQTVTTQQFKKRCALHPLVRDIVQIDSSGVALELDVETELGLLHCRGEIVDVLHHQVPVVL